MDLLAIAAGVKVIEEKKKSSEDPNTLIAHIIGEGSSSAPSRSKEQKEIAQKDRGALPANKDTESTRVPKNIPLKSESSIYTPLGEFRFSAKPKSDGEALLGSLGIGNTKEPEATSVEVRNGPLAGTKFTVGADGKLSSETIKTAFGPVTLNVSEWKSGDATKIGATVSEGPFKGTNLEWRNGRFESSELSLKAGSGIVTWELQGEKNEQGQIEGSGKWNFEVTKGPNEGAVLSYDTKDGVVGACFSADIGDGKLELNWQGGAPEREPNSIRYVANNGAKVTLSVGPELSIDDKERGKGKGQLGGGAPLDGGMQKAALLGGEEGPQGEAPQAEMRYMVDFVNKSFPGVSGVRAVVGADGKFQGVRVGFSGGKEEAFVSYNASTQQYRLSLPKVQLGGTPLSIDLKLIGGRLSGSTGFQIGQGKGEVRFDDNNGLMLSYNNEKGVPWAFGVGLNQSNRLNLFFDYQVDKHNKINLSLGGPKQKADVFFYTQF